MENILDLSSTTIFCEISILNKKDKTYKIYLKCADNK